MKLRKLSILIWGVVLFICILNFYFHFFIFSFFRTTAFEAIPSQSILIVECQDLSSINKSNPKGSDWSAIQRIPFFQKLNNDLETLNSKVLHNPDSINVFEQNKFVAALQKSSVDEFDFLYVFENEDILLSFEKLQELENVTIQESKYLRENVYEVIQGKDRFTFCFL